MAIRTVLQLGDPGLREIAKKVEDPTAPAVRALVEDLADTDADDFVEENQVAAGDDVAVDDQIDGLVGGFVQRDDVLLA